jgi:hypothetical protein
MSVYVGVAEAARDLAVQSAQHKLDDSDIWYLTGELDNALVTAQIAVESMIDLCANLAFVPEVATVNATFHSQDHRGPGAAECGRESRGNM